MKKQYLVWVLKGAAMGAADAVPGVSGGTMALITGIYERFIAALASFKPELLHLVMKKDFRLVWQKIDGEFLLCVGIGIIFSLFTVLNLMHWLLALAAPAVWSFFMGVILASLLQLVTVRQWPAAEVLLFIFGLLIAGALAFATGVQLQSNALTLVIGGAIAISAMLLPGISGSFMLLLLGLYPDIVEAVHQRDLLVLFWVALGCLIGVLSFSRLLQWALLRWHNGVMSFLIGFVAGALIKVWPWQWSGQWLLPGQYVTKSGLPAWEGVAMVTFFSGVVTILILKTLTKK